MAGRLSTIDTHPQRKSIISGILAGDTAESLAKRFGVSVFAIGRYKTGVIRPALKGKQVSVNVADTDSAVSEIREQRVQAQALIRSESTVSLVQKRLADYDRILSKAEETGDLSAWSSVDKAETAKLRLMAELSGELQPQSTQTTAIVLLMPQQPSQAQQPAIDAIDAEWTPG